MADEEKKKKQLHFREVSAGCMLLFGCALTVAGFCVSPLGEISQTVILIFSQCLLYAGAALGIDVVIDRKIHSFTNDTKRVKK